VENSAIFFIADGAVDDSSCEAECRNFAFTRECQLSEAASTPLKASVSAAEHGLHATGLRQK